MLCMTIPHSDEDFLNAWLAPNNACFAVRNVRPLSHPLAVLEDKHVHVCVSVCVCVCVCVCACVCRLVHVYMCTCISTCVHVCMLMRGNVSERGSVRMLCFDQPPPTHTHTHTGNLPPSLYPSPSQEYQQWQSRCGYARGEGRTCTQHCWCPPLQKSREQAM